MADQTISAPRGVPETEVERQLEEQRRALTGYCYRMLGSAADAEDAVQETFVRAWRGIDRFEGRAALRTWLYKIASNVCFDALAANKKRATPFDMGPAGRADGALAPPLPEQTWLGPIPDALVIAPDGDPALVAEARESVRLAFVAALQHLPPRQRAVLILREVLGWRAAEVADLLHLTEVAVNSALQRARATLAARDLELAEFTPSSVEEASEALLARYVDAFERYDMDALRELIHEDATQSMPPYAMWLRGREQLIEWMLGMGAGCEGSRLVQLAVNGQVGFAQYRDGGATPWSINLPVWSGEQIVDITYFLETDGSLFEQFGLPKQLPAA